MGYSAQVPLVIGQPGFKVSNCSLIREQFTDGLLIGRFVLAPLAN